MTPVLATPPRKAPPRAPVKALRRAPMIPAPQTVPWIIALEGGKGGTGKSTLACCLAFEALGRRRRVLLLDADPQATARTWATVAAEAGQPVLLDAAAAAAQAGALIVVLSAGEDLHQQVHALAAQVQADLVLIDCAGRLDRVQRASLAVADLVLLPCSPDSTDLWALTGSADLVKEALQHRPTLRAAVLLNKMRSNTVLAKNARTSAPEAGLPLLKCELGNRVAFPLCMAAGRGPSALVKKEVEAAAEMAALYKEVTKLLGSRG